MSRLILQRFDGNQSGPFDPFFPPIVEFCQRNQDGSHIFPDRDVFFRAAKQGQKQLDHPQYGSLDDYLDGFFNPEGYAHGQLRILGQNIEKQLSQTGAFSQSAGKPVVEIIAPRKAAFDGNIGAIMLAETVADRLNHIVPAIDWGVAYDVVYQAPLSDAPTGIPTARKHPGYAKQSQYMALNTFAHPGRTPYLVGIDDSTRFGRAARDLGLFAQQNGKKLLGFAVFQSYISPSLSQEPATKAAFDTHFSADQQRALNTALHPFGLNTHNLTEPEMQFFTTDDMFNKPGQSRLDAVIDYLSAEENSLRCPVILPRHDHFFRHIEEGKPLRFARLPAPHVQTAPTVRAMARRH